MSDPASKTPLARWADAITHNGAAFITGRPWLMMALSVVVALLLCGGLGQLAFRSDSRVFFSPGDPELQALDKFEEVYGRDDTLLFVVDARQGDLFTPQRIGAINALTDKAWQLPDVKRVDSFTNFQRALAAGDDVVIDQFSRSGDSVTAADAARLRREAGREPLMIGRLLSRDGKLAIVAVNFRFDPKTASTQGSHVMQQAKPMVEAFNRAHPDLRAGLSGSIALDEAFVEASTFDSSVLLPLMVTVLAVIMILALRSPTAALATLAMIALGTLSALGLTGFLGIPLSSPSVVAPNIILTIACCDSIHLCSGMLRLRREGLSKIEAVREIMIECWWPVSLTTVTTATGFLSLAFSPVPPFAHLGMIVTLGSVLTWLLTFTFLPPLLILLPWKGSAKPLPAENLAVRASDFVIGRPRAVLLTVTVLSVLLTALAFTNRLDDRYVHYFDHGYAFRQTTDRMNEKLGGFYSIELSLDSRAPDGVGNPAYLAEVDRLAQWLRTQPGVTHVHGVTDILKTVNRAMNGGSQHAYRLPADQETGAQYLALYEMSLPFGMDLKNEITADKRSSRLVVALGDTSTASMAALAARTKQWAAKNTPLIAPSVKPTGTSLLFAHIGNRNIREMLVGIFTGIGVVVLIFLLAFRSLTLSLIGTIANFVPSLVTLGIWAIFNGQVGMAVAAVASVTFGVVVDDTIHMLTTYRHLRKDEGLDAVEAVRGAFRIAGPGMVTMTMALAAGFGCLAFSGFQINSWMGAMAAFTIVTAMFFDLLFLPAALLCIAQIGARLRPTSSSGATVAVTAPFDADIAKQAA